MRCSYYFYLFLLLIISSCSVKPQLIYNVQHIPAPPDYSDMNYWAALPEKKDSADSVPEAFLANNQAQSDIDVFFIHPTTYTGDKGHKNWNGPLDDAVLNEKTDKGTILNQASIFNGIGRVYAPRYRQAHIQVYYPRTPRDIAQEAIDLAYADIKAAFNYYLKNNNQDRPIIIAAHSQGTTHGERLIKEFFDGTPLQDKLVVAYLVGMPVEKKAFDYINTCKTPEDTNCFCSWRTFKKGYLPKKYPTGDHIAVTNPLTWTTDTALASQSLNEGAVLRKFDKGYVENLVNAQIHQGVLWVDKPKFPGSFLVLTPDYHIADFNFFYANIRKNAKHRAQIYRSKQQMK